jgi:lipoyl(octanoyl) transferase
LASHGLADEEAQRVLQWAFLGRVDYDQALELQKDARERLRNGIDCELLLFLEHPHTYTLGRSADRSEILADADWLTSHGVTLAETDRGGQVTYHGPGQLVGYPIIDLGPDRRDIRRYMRDLQEVLVRTLRVFGVAAEARHEQRQIGVWCEGQKVASLGVHVSRWITTHGFALNVGTDLSYFSGIVPCGMPGVEMASIESLTGAAPPMEEVASVCVRLFGEIFRRQPQPLQFEDLISPQ